MNLGKIVCATLAGLMLGTGYGKAQTGATPPRVNCTMRKTALSDAEAALARDEYSAALNLYREMAKTDPNTGKAGTIRTLIEQNELNEAVDQSQAWAKAEPKNAVAIETLAEELFREGELANAAANAELAHTLDTCNARVYLLTARLDDMKGNFATGQKHIELAHRLDPVDPEIRWQWINTLPRARRMEETAAVLREDKVLASKRKERVADALAHANDSEKDECTMIRRIESDRVAIQPMLDGKRVAGLALDVSFNGKRRRLEIDTGASGLVLSRGAASGLGLLREQKTASDGIGDEGEVATSIAHVESVRIGDMEFQNCAVHILERRRALDIDGLIGGNVFSKYLLTLDFPKMELRIDPLPKRPGETDKLTASLDTTGDEASKAVVAIDKNEESHRYDRYIAPEMQDWTKVYRIGHNLLVPVTMTDEKQKRTSKDKLFIVDTGSDSILISPDAASGVTKVHNDYTVGVHGIAGDVKRVYSTEGLNFYFAHLKQPVYEVTAMDTTRLSHDEGVEVSGLLGATVLHRVTLHIDYRDNLIKLDFDPEHDRPGSAH
ncbi:Flp pilus assembly protein TadD, contains TPR repeats [Granulicella rosea]|uniref:Flp pilus assembly protein TadD, contains TPR repeats n=1 Tax=Granulicella rosea TaxID=474952 RepID=A0A239KU63_9BACT|nr:retropepsin-like aspartic protease [Granulicella rosea]SNT20774.1 Flp pilus assembly protein TadD, contains TPR repeats [Granulicella rosea]